MKERFIRKILLLILNICMAFNNSLQAQNQRILTLDETISLGINHSKNLALDDINLQLADSKILQNKNLKLPQIGLNLSYVRVSDNITPFKVAFPQGEVILNP